MLSVKMKPLFWVSIIAATASVISAESIVISIVDNERNGTVERLCRAEMAQFGPTEDFYGITGVIVNAVPVNGCQPLRPPPFRRNDTLTWVALMARDENSASSCFFDRKILHAQEAGFGAALIYNYQDAISGMQASSLGDKIAIPAAMITYTCGRLMQQKYAYSPPEVEARYTITFRDYYSFDFDVYVISFVSVICACFLLFTLLWGLRWFRDWRIRQRSRLSRSSLKKLKVKKFEKGTDPYDCCAICLEDFEPGDKLRILPCNHAYHVKCIDPWLLRSRSVCPVCKRRVFPRRPGDGEAADGGDDSDDGAAETATAAATAASAVPAAAAASATAAGAEIEEVDGERTPLLASGGSSASSSSGVRAFDNPALRLQESPRLSAVATAVAATATAAAAAATVAAAASPNISRSSSSSSVISECGITESEVSVSSLPLSDGAASSADGGGDPLRRGEVLTTVRVHASSSEAESAEKNTAVVV